jgi:DEAD/DEAH box helicase domain-containing protein
MYASWWAIPAPISAPGSAVAGWGAPGRPSGIFLVAQPDALDQYFLKHPDRFFERPLEAAVADPDNPKIVGPHLVCAAAEEPLVIKHEQVSTLSCTKMP